MCLLLHSFSYHFSYLPAYNSECIISLHNANIGFVCINSTIFNLKKNEKKVIVVPVCDLQLFLKCVLFQRLQLAIFNFCVSLICMVRASSDCITTSISRTPEYRGKVRRNSKRKKKKSEHVKIYAEEMNGNGTRLMHV